MIAWLFALAAGIGGTEAVHAVLHHYKIQVAAVLAATAMAIAGWAYKQRRLVMSTGQRVKPREAKAKPATQARAALITDEVTP